MFLAPICDVVMDAAELPFPVDVEAPKLMGSEGFSRVGVTVNGAEACDSDSVPVSRSGEMCSSFVGRKEKNHLVKQKNLINGKKGEKRNKVLLKSKHDTFPVKAGSSSFGTASGGSNFLGAYGLKSDAHDVTKLIDDISLIGLLNGTYEAPSLGKNTRKKEPVTSDTLLHSVRKAGSALELRRPLQPQKFDNSSYQKLSTIDLSSADKNRDPLIKPETPGDVLDYPLYQPKDMLERLSLPPQKDLDSLLQDAGKPTVSSRNTGKQIACRPSLPAFPWLYNFSGQSRNNADMIKLSLSKNPCHGRWGRIEKTDGAVQVSSHCFSNLDSLKYDDNLVPSERLKLCTSAHKIAPYLSGSLLWSELDSSSPLEENCPRILAAAQTLINMAATVRQGRDGLTWQKKASQKVSKACKSRAIEKGLDRSSMTTSFLRSANASTSVDRTFPSKKPKLSTTEKRKDPSHASIRNESMNWSTPKSVRSQETRHSSSTVMKQSSMMPPPARASGKSYECEHKMRNLIMEWQNGERHSNAQTRDSSSTGRVLGKACNGEKKRKAHENEERPRNSEIDNMVMNWQRM